MSQRVLANLNILFVTKDGWVGVLGYRGRWDITTRTIDYMTVSQMDTWTGGTRRVNDNAMLSGFDFAFDFRN